MSAERRSGNVGRLSRVRGYVVKASVGFVFLTGASNEAGAREQAKQILRGLLEMGETLPKVTSITIDEVTQVHPPRPSDLSILLGSRRLALYAN